MHEPDTKMSRPFYRKYPEAVRTEISRTGNIYLFPNMRIPRTTAQYWVKNKRSTPEPEDLDSIYREECESLKRELEKEKALRRLAECVRNVFPFDFQKTHVKSKITRTQIVKVIQECQKLNKLSICLSSIGLTKSTYQRWASEVSFCASTKSTCQRRKPSQLTEVEIGVMKRFVTSKKYAHVSVSSLHLLAQRTGVLFCSLDTWYKYIRYFSWKRPAKIERKPIKKTGIRASQPNQLWHVDVTVVNLSPGRKLYIQAVIDNFSRYVVAWRVSDSISAAGTVEVLATAKKNASNMNDVTTVLTDPGSENNNRMVKEFTISQNMRRVLARVEVHYSNSMIESLFRMLKNNFLYHQDIRNIQDLERKARFYFTQHNQVIPQAVLKGSTPFESYRRLWTKQNEDDLKTQRTEAVIARRIQNLAPPCHVCPGSDTGATLIVRMPPKNSAEQVQKPEPVTQACAL